jgi:hypothetical protein
MVTSTALAMLMLLVIGATHGTNYRAVSLERLSAAPDVYVGQRVLTTGMYRERVSLSYTVDAWLEDGGVRLPILGPVFDWEPSPGQRIDVWGVLRRDRASGELFLDFFNGRTAGDHRRAPRLVPAFRVGRTAWLVGRLRQTGSEPFVRWILVLEDRTEVDLLGDPPSEFTTMSGVLVQIQGRIEPGPLPPSTAAVRVLRIQQLPGSPAPPFGG